MTGYPTARHLNCEEHGCQICLSDFDSLSSYLQDRIDFGKRHVPGEEIRRLLDFYGEPAETDHGWFTAAWFDPFWIDLLIEEWNVDQDVSRERVLRQRIADLKPIGARGAAWLLAEMDSQRKHGGGS